MKNFYIFCLTFLFAVGANADLTSQEIAEIEASISSMSSNALQD